MGILRSFTIRSSIRMAARQDPTIRYGVDRRPREVQRLGV